MSKSCCVKGCTNNIKNNPEYSYYALPSSSNRRKLWLAEIGWAVVDNSGNVCKNKFWFSKSVHHYVCSKHFIPGDFFLKNDFKTLYQRLSEAFIRLASLVARDLAR